MTDLEALALRCEGAGGPDRELDLAVHLAIHPGSEIHKIMETGRRGLDGQEGRAWELGSGALLYEVRNASGNCWANGGIPVPRYTASLDAAMSLVPEGCGWIAGWGQTLPDEPMGGARVTRNARFVGYDANYDAISEAEAATPALALCAAALRARALSHDKDQAA